MIAVNIHAKHFKYQQPLAMLRSKQYDLIYNVSRKFANLKMFNVEF